MASTNSRGNYYKRKTRDWYEAQGYTVELTEFVCGRMIGKGKIIYQKRDVLASDGIAYNAKEFILWNSKHTVTGVTDQMKYKGKEEYKKILVPPFIRKEVIIWQPRIKEPKVIKC
jgi:hypothetical protein